MRHGCDCNPPEPVTITVPLDAYERAVMGSAGAVQQLNDWREFVRAMLPKLPDEVTREEFRKVFGVPVESRHGW